MDVKQGDWAVYDILSAVERQSPPVISIEIGVGPDGEEGLRWWEMRGHKASGESFAIHVLSSGIPMSSDGGTGRISRYLLREGDDQPIEYIDAGSGDALLPKFDFVESLLPRASAYTNREDGFASTGTCLGHVLSLKKTDSGREWPEWPFPTPIRLSQDEIHYMYGLSRDEEGEYIPEGDYTYVRLTREELDEMVDLGLNCLTVGDEHEEWVYRRPVFYYKRFPENGRLNYPEILYRSNYRGAVAFIDEPEIHILKDTDDLSKIRRPEEGAFLLTKRAEEIWNHPAPNEGRRGLLRAQLQARGANLGTLDLDDDDHPIWVTMFETSFYQLQGGASGAVHEGRYDVGEFIKECEKFLDGTPEISDEDLLRLTYSWLRGAARTFNKSWGMSIYGQCDPEIAPLAVTLAYDMGARYIWLWTFDHQHHLPHYMKLRLLEHLKEHKKAHPRRPISDLLHAAKTAVVLPYGYGYTLEFRQMWESPHLNIESTNEAGVQHRVVVGAALAAGIACAKAGEDFDFVVDAGQELTGYKRVIMIGRDGSSRVIVNSDRL